MKGEVEGHRQVSPVGPSEDELQLWTRLGFVPGQTGPSAGQAVDLKWNGSAVIIVHDIRIRGHLFHQVLVPGVVRYVVFYFMLLLGLELIQTAAYPSTPAASMPVRESPSTIMTAKRQIATTSDGDGHLCLSSGPSRDQILQFYITDFLLLNLLSVGHGQPGSQPLSVATP